MLRITVLAEDPASATVRVEGRIVEGWAQLLAQECEALLARSATVSLELGGVSFVDEAGAAVLASLPPERVRLCDQSPLLQVLISNRGSEWTAQP